MHLALSISRPFSITPSPTVGGVKPGVPPAIRLALPLISIRSQGTFVAQNVDDSGSQQKGIKKAPVFRTEALV